MSTTSSPPPEGSISAEHGIGQLKREEFAHSRPPAASSDPALKHALDPLGIMNPGKLVP